MELLPYNENAARPLAGGRRVKPVRYLRHLPELRCCFASTALRDPLGSMPNGNRTSAVIGQACQRITGMLLGLGAPGGTTPPYGPAFRPVNAVSSTVHCGIPRDQSPTRATAVRSGSAMYLAPPPRYRLSTVQVDSTSTTPIKV